MHNLRPATARKISQLDREPSILRDPKQKNERLFGGYLRKRTREIALYVIRTLPGPARLVGRLHQTWQYLWPQGAPSLVTPATFLLISGFSLVAAYPSETVYYWTEPITARFL